MAIALSSALCAANRCGIVTRRQLDLCGEGQKLNLEQRGRSVASAERLSAAMRGNHASAAFKCARLLAAWPRV
jgi:hypothetical protein